MALKQVLRKIKLCVPENEAGLRNTGLELIQVEWRHMSLDGPWHEHAIVQKCQAENNKNNNKNEKARIVWWVLINTGGAKQQKKIHTK